MDIKEINSSIMFGSFNNDELTSVIEAVKYARSRLQKQTIRSLMVGDNVNFNSAKMGRNVTGVVTKIAVKYVTVNTTQGLWKVPANMLTVIAEEEFA